MNKKDDKKNVKGYINFMIAACALSVVIIFTISLSNGLTAKNLFAAILVSAVAVLGITLIIIMMKKTNAPGEKEQAIFLGGGTRVNPSTNRPMGEYAAFQFADGTIHKLNITQAEIETLQENQSGTLSYKKLFGAEVFDSFEQDNENKQFSTQQ